MHENTAQPPSIRDLMPDRYIKELKLRTGCKQRQTLWEIVKEEVTGSKYWPAIEALARETNPEGFAQWQAAQHQHASAA